jgi:hypothetical protein
MELLHGGVYRADPVEQSQTPPKSSCQVELHEREIIEQEEEE